jgi:hypothetical protein
MIKSATYWVNFAPLHNRPACSICPSFKRAPTRASIRQAVVPGAETWAARQSAAVLGAFSTFR